MSLEVMKQALEALGAYMEATDSEQDEKAHNLMATVFFKLKEAIEQAENYQHKNPLGGPAKVFDAMADAIRAGDDYHATLRSYGFLEREDKKTIDCSGAAGPSITPLNWHSYADKQRALDKKAENARELGLDYEPVQAEKQEPVAHRYCCHSCFKASGGVMLDRMILCPECGNKRCPKASDHSFSCAGSNEPGQIGSIYSVSATVFVQEPATDEEMKRAKPVCADFFSFRAGVRYAESKFKEKRS